jgi:hypothetical protein
MSQFLNKRKNSQRISLSTAVVGGKLAHKRMPSYASYLSSRWPIDLIGEFANRQKCLVPDIRLYLSRRAENLRLDMPTPQLFANPPPID